MNTDAASVHVFQTSMGESQKQTPKVNNPPSLPSITEVNKLKNDELKTHLKNSIAMIESLAQKEQPRDPFNMETLLARIDEKMQTRLDEFKDKLSQDLQINTQKQIETANEPLKQRITHLERENDDLRKSLTHHQKFLETLDNQQRSRFLIVTGVPEGSGIEHNQRTAYSDEHKIEMIFRKIQVEATAEDIQRLGKFDPDRVRPIKITVENTAIRNKVLERAKYLKDHDTPESKFNKIFLKKDLHPLVRQEWNRLYETQRKEKEKPENKEKEVLVNRKDRTVTVNGEIVDKFQNF